MLARSVSLPAEERRKTLRQLQVRWHTQALFPSSLQVRHVHTHAHAHTLTPIQVRWHPDKQVGADNESRAFALELMQMINKQATIAKSNAAEIGALKRRQDAFAELERAMPAVLFGRVVSSTTSTALEELQRAIGAAREANVSQQVDPHLSLIEREPHTRTPHQARVSTLHPQLPTRRSPTPRQGLRSLSGRCLPAELEGQTGYLGRHHLASDAMHDAICGSLCEYAATLELRPLSQLKC